MRSKRVLKSASLGLGLALLGSAVSVLGGATSATAATSATTCVATAGAVTDYPANTSAVYIAPAGMNFVRATAVGGAGSKEDGDQLAGGLGAQVTSIVTVPALGHIGVFVGQSATQNAGGESGGAVSGGAGDTWSVRPASYYSGGGGGASLASIHRRSWV
jgi:hypothetical protein